MHHRETNRVSKHPERKMELASGGDYEGLLSYGSDWQEVSSLYINRNQLYIALIQVELK